MTSPIRCCNFTISDQIFIPNGRYVRFFFAGFSFRVMLEVGTIVEIIDDIECILIQ